MGVFSYVRSQLDRRQMNREFKESFETLKQGYEALDKNQLKVALRDMYDALFCVGTYAKKNGELVQDLTVPSLPSEGYYVDRFENQMNALLSVVKSRFELKEDVPPADPAKYLDFKSRDPDTFGYHDPMTNGNPKLAQMEAKLLGYGKALNVEDMERFSQWRDGINYGDNVQPAAWYWSHPSQHEPKESALDKIRSIFPPDYYTSAFPSEKERQTKQGTRTTVPTQPATKKISNKDMLRSSSHSVAHTTQTNKSKSQLSLGMIARKGPDR